MHENGAQHGSQLFAKLGFKELVGIRSDKETSCTTAWSFFIGGNMSKIAIGFVSLVLACIIALTDGLSVQAAAFTRVRVGYTYYTTSDTYVECWAKWFDSVEDAQVGLFQIAQDDLAQRSDGYLFECNTKWELQGVTEDNSVMIKYSNPMTYNLQVPEVAMSNPYNRIDIYLHLSDGSTISFESIGGKNDLGNIAVFELYEYGTCEMSEEIVITLIRGVAIDSVDIRVSMFADMRTAPYRPMSWFGNASIEFGNYYNTGAILADIDRKADAIITPSVDDSNKVTDFEDSIADKGEQSDQLLEDSKVEKPTVSDEILNPMDKVDDDALDSMGGMIGAVFVSPTLGSIALLTLTFAFLGFILYGKR